MSDRLITKNGRLEVTDGDTFKDLVTGEIIRLNGIDTPETAGHKGYASDRMGSLDARTNLLNLLNDSNGIKIDRVTTDKYKRTVANIIAADGTDLSAAQISSGNALPAFDPNSTQSLAQHDAIMQAENRPDRQAQLDNALVNGAGELLTEGTKIKDHTPVGKAAVNRGINNTRATLFGFVNAVGQVTNSDLLAKYGEQGIIDNVRRAMSTPAKIQSYDDINSLSDFGTYILETFGEQAPQLGLDLASFATGGVVGGAASAASKRMVAAQIGKNFKRLLGEAAFSKITKDPAAFAKLTGKAGAFGSMYAQSTGETQMELRDNGIEAPGTALGVGAVKAWLEYSPLEHIAGQAFKTLKRSDIGKEQFSDIVKRVGAKTLGAMGLEATTEGAQTVADKVAVYLNNGADPFSPENVKEIIDSSIRGGIVGGGMSGTSQVAAEGINKLATSLNRKPDAGTQATASPPVEPSGDSGAIVRPSESATNSEPKSDLRAQLQDTGNPDSPGQAVFFSSEDSAKAQDLFVEAHADGQKVYSAKAPDGSVMMSLTPESIQEWVDSGFDPAVKEKALGIVQPKSEMTDEQMASTAMYQRVDQEGNVVREQLATPDKAQAAVDTLAQGAAATDSIVQTTPTEALQRRDELNRVEAITEPQNIGNTNTVSETLPDTPAKETVKEAEQLGVSQENVQKATELYQQISNPDNQMSLLDTSPEEFVKQFLDSQKEELVNLDPAQFVANHLGKQQSLFDNNPVESAAGGTDNATGTQDGYPTSLGEDSGNNQLSDGEGVGRHTSAIPTEVRTEQRDAPYSGRSDGNDPGGVFAAGPASDTNEVLPGKAYETRSSPSATFRSPHDPRNPYHRIRVAGGRYSRAKNTNPGKMSDGDVIAVAEGYITQPRVKALYDEIIGDGHTELQASRILYQVVQDLCVSPKARESFAQEKAAKDAAFQKSVDDTFAEIEKAVVDHGNWQEMFFDFQQSQLFTDVLTLAPYTRGIRPPSNVESPVFSEMAKYGLSPSQSAALLVQMFSRISATKHDNAEAIKLMEKLRDPELASTLARYVDTPEMAAIQEIVDEVAAKDVADLDISDEFKMSDADEFLDASLSDATISDIEGMSILNGSDALDMDMLGVESALKGISLTAKRVASKIEGLELRFPSLKFTAVDSGKVFTHSHSGSDGNLRTEPLFNIVAEHKAFDSFAEAEAEIQSLEVKDPDAAFEIGYFSTSSRGEEVFTPLLKDPELPTSEVTTAGPEQPSLQPAPGSFGAKLMEALAQQTDKKDTGRELPEKYVIRKVPNDFAADPYKEASLFDSFMLKARDQVVTITNTINRSIDKKYADLSWKVREHKKNTEGKLHPQYQRIVTMTNSFTGETVQFAAPSITEFGMNLTIDLDTRIGMIDREFSAFQAGVAAFARRGWVLHRQEDIQFSMETMTSFNQVLKNKAAISDAYDAINAFEEYDSVPKYLADPAIMRALRARKDEGTALLRSMQLDRLARKEPSVDTASQASSENDLSRDEFGLMDTSGEAGAILGAYQHSEYILSLESQIDELETKLEELRQKYRDSATGIKDKTGSQVDHLRTMGVSKKEAAKIQAQIEGLRARLDAANYKDAAIPRSYDDAATGPRRFDENNKFIQYPSSDLPVDIFSVAPVTSATTDRNIVGVGSTINNVETSFIDRVFKHLGIDGFRNRVMLIDDDGLSWMRTSHPDVAKLFGGDLSAGRIAVYGKDIIIYTRNLSEDSPALRANRFIVLAHELSHLVSWHILKSLPDITKKQLAKRVKTAVKRGVSRYAGADGIDEFLADKIARHLLSNVDLSAAPVDSTDIVAKRIAKAQRKVFEASVKEFLSRSPIGKKRFRPDELVKSLIAQHIWTDSFSTMSAKDFGAASANFGESVTRPLGDALAEANLSPITQAIYKRFPAAKQNRYVKFAADFAKGLGGMASKMLTADHQMRQIKADLADDFFQITSSEKSNNEHTWFRGRDNNSGRWMGEWNGVWSNMYDKSKYPNGLTTRAERKAAKKEAIERTVKALDELSRADDNALTQKQAAGRKLPAGTHVLSEDASTIAEFMHDLHGGYLKQHMPTLGKLNAYFPRIYDVEALNDRASEFVQLLQRELGMSAQEAEDTRRSIVERNGLNDFNIDDIMEKVTVPGLDARRSRKLRKPGFAKALDDAGFVAKNKVESMDQYIHAAVKRAETERKFGDYEPSLTREGNPLIIRHPKDQYEIKRNTEHVNRYLEMAGQTATGKGWKADLQKLIDMGYMKWLDREATYGWYRSDSKLLAKLNSIQDPMERARAKQIIDGYFGRLGTELDPNVRKTMGWLMVYQNYLTLWLGTLSSLTDFAGPLIRAREYDLAWQGLKAAVRTLRDPQQRHEFAHILNMVNARMTHASINDLYGMGYLSGSQAKANDFLFKYNGQELLTGLTRVFAAAAGQEFLVLNAQKAKNGDTEAQRYLKELNIDADTVIRWQENGGKFWTRERAKGWTEAQQRDEEAVRSAVRQFTDESIMRPNAAQRPVWASNPVFMLLWHLKSFFYSMGKTILNGVFREAFNNRQGQGFLRQSAPFVMLAMFMLPLAAVGLELREIPQYEVFGQTAPTERMDGMRLAWEYVSRAGMLGPLELANSMVMNNGEDDVGRASAGLAGPVFDHVYKFLSTDDWQMSNVGKRSIPILNQTPGFWAAIK